jgi:hypothetical protein
VEQLEQNILVVKTLKPMSRNEQQQILARTRQGPYGSRIERYKRKEAGALHPVHQDGEPV